jgi:hypothetical protein
LLGQQNETATVLFGISVLTPRTFGATSGPPLVTAGNSVDPRNLWYWWGGPITSFDDRLSMGDPLSFSISVGLRIEPWQTSFVATLHAELVRLPSRANAGHRGFELSGRHALGEIGPVDVYGVISISRWYFSNEDRPFEYGYDFGKSFWIPGVGVGAKYSVIIVEAQFQGWPRLEIANAAEPNGIPPGTPGQVWYTVKPIYLKYAVSLTVGLEFELLSF